MNLLEHYIKEIKSELEIAQFDKVYIKARLIVECYGVVNETTEIFTEEEWEKVKAQGYYMA